MIPTTFIVNGVKITLLEARAVSLSIQGLQRKTIAELMGITVSTHSKRMNQLFLKFGMPSNICLVVFLLTHGFDRKGCLNGIYLFETDWSLFTVGAILLKA